ncbi:MAG: 23S rRNA (guanosine(2251)-2'-O)-methyltransferase RlmB [Deltaproteobacteria bacterium]|nr:23S rRNA (guanosine(2251)-2'-O)-methyltransferase RlmB [Deltaproteobacteria bacterium]
MNLTPTFIPGFHGVREILRQGSDAIQEIWIASGKKPGRTEEILRIAKERKIPVLFKKPKELSRHLPGVAHQGIVAVAETFDYTDLNQIMEAALQRGRHALIVVADHITDQGNLGALIRTSAFFGADGLIIPADRSARPGPGMFKRSAGAYVHIPVARVVNIGRALNLLAKRGFWIIGTAGEASTSVYCFDWNRHVALVLGNEQKGLSRPARKSCHEIVGIPSQSPVESLNVSISAGVILSEILRQRNREKGPAGNVKRDV